MSVKRIISPRRHTPEIELPAPVIPSQGVIETSDKQYSEDVLHVLINVLQLHTYQVSLFNFRTN